MTAGTPEGLCPACLLRRGLETQTGGYGADFTPPTAEELASYFPQLEILELLGRGGMGVVYKARQRELDRLVALKILPSASDPAFAERFTREARALARLSHPNIVAVYDYGQTNGLAYFMMEYVDGLNLRQLQAAARMTPQEALAIVPQICEALQVAHDQGIVHRDIKPENLLIDRKGRVKIADFGIAKIVGAEGLDLTLTGAGEMVGTPAYMAPEQIEHPADVDHRADIYSLGVVFYQMLTGELPLGKFAPPSRKVKIDVRLDDVVLRALEKEPELRYQQASEVRTQVETIAGSPGAAAAAPLKPDLEQAGVPLLPGSFGLSFKSPIALKIARIGWVLGCLGALGFLARPLFGLFGFFGLIGVAVIVEMAHRGRAGNVNAAAMPTGPRFSWTAMVGAAWAPWFFIGFVLIFSSQIQRAGTYEGPSILQKVMAGLFIAVGGTAPFGTTILGWVAVSQIRHSAGKLHGMWLAVADGLLFPILALDGVLAYLAVLNRIVILRPPGQLVVVLCVLWVAVDFFVIRGVWLMANDMPSSRHWRLAAKVACGIAAVALIWAGAVNLLRPRRSAARSTSPMTEIAAAHEAEGRDVLAMQYRQARRIADQKEAEYKVGAAGGLEYRDAEDKADVLEAELTGDAITVARVKLQGAQKRLELISNLAKAGVVNPEDYEKARGSVEVAEAELRQVEGNTPPQPASAPGNAAEPERDATGMETPALPERR